MDDNWVTALFGLVVAILTWDYVQIVPAAGLDASWALSLNLAAIDGLNHGSEFVFTYGPLGVLEQPMVLDGTIATAGAIYLLGLRAALAASLLWIARRSFSWLPAALLAAIAAVLVPRAVGSVVLTLAVIWCLVALQDEAPRWVGRAVIVGGGALAGLELLVKPNIGVTILVIVLVTTLALEGDRLRNVLKLAGAFLVTATVGWLASGQGVGSVGDYVTSSIQVISGYQEAMQLEKSPVAWDGWAAVVLGVATLAATAVASAGLPLIRRLAMIAIVALLLASLQKYAFVRHDIGHVGAFFGILAAIWLALRWRGLARIPAVAWIVVIAAIYFPVTDESFGTSFEPELAVDQLGDLVLSERREQAADEARAALRAGYGVDPELISQIGDASVDARPWEVALTWAYDLDYEPLPVIQDYIAYTPKLDQLNADTLVAGDGPRFVLRHLGYGNSPLIGIEGRLTTFDSPAATRALLCGYEPVITSEAYQLIERGDNRCGEERALGSVTAAYGETVPVPEARSSEAVFARIDGAAAGGIEKLRALAFKPAVREIEFNLGSARLPAANAVNGLLLQAPAAADFPEPFRLAPGTERLSVDSEGGFATSEGPLEIEFFAVSIRPGSAGP